MIAISRERPSAVYYEHPHWFHPLFAELERRGVPYVPINRMSPSAYLRGHGDAIL